MRRSFGLFFFNVLLPGAFFFYGIGGTQLAAAPITINKTFNNIQYTVSYDNIACVGQQVTLTYSAQNTSSQPIADQCAGPSNPSMQGFVPDPTQTSAPGLINPIIVPPQPSGTASFDPTAPSNCASALGTPCPINGSLGVWVLANPFPAQIVYSFTVTVTAASCGLQQFSVCELCDGFAECIGTVAILVIPTLDFSAAIYGPICANSAGITGNLPAPSCTGCGTTDCGAGPYHYTVSNATGGTVTLLNASGGYFQFVPSAGFSGDATFQYNIVSDTSPPAFCSNASGDAEVIVNPNPTVTNPTFTVCQGGVLNSSLAPYATGLGQILFTQVGPLNCSGASVNLDPSGNFTFTGPTGGVPAVCNFVFDAIDFTFPHCDSTGLATFVINAAPTANDQTLSTCVNTPVSGTLTASGGSGSGYIFIPTGGPSNGMVAPFDEVSGDFTYTPDPDFVGTDSFTFRVTDSNGCTSLVDGTVTIVVSPLPMTSTGAINVCENTSYTGSLAGLVTGGTGPQVFTQVGPAPTCGSVFIESSGNFTFVPNFNATGNCSFNYQVTQGGCPGTGPNTVFVTVFPAPTATGGSFSTCLNHSVTGDLNNFVISAPPVVSFTSVGTPSNGTLNLSPSGSFIFTPNTGFSGPAGFQFEVISSSVSCPSSPETISITVNPPPSAQTGTILACSNTSTVGNLNTLVTGTPPFTFTGPLSESGGTVTINPNGVFTFTPNPGSTSGSFTFGITDANGCTGQGGETIVVNPSPTASNGTGAACSNGSSTGSVAGLVTGGTPPYTFYLINATNGTALVNENGTFVFVANAGATTGSITFGVRDAIGCQSSGTITLTIHQSPSGTGASITGCSTTFSGSLVPFVQGGVPPYTFTGPIGPVYNGNVTISSTGLYTFVPYASNGTGSFSFEVSDSGNPSCTSNPIPVLFSIGGPELILPVFNTCENTPFISGLSNYVTGGEPPYTYAQVQPLPSCGSVLLNPFDGSFLFAPNANFIGTCDFYFTVTDATPCTSNVAQATILVHQTPTAGSTGPFTGCVGNPFTGTLVPLVTGGVPPYQFTESGAPINGTVAIEPAGSYVFTPSAAGPASFDYSASDNFGCVTPVPGTVSFAVQPSPILTIPAALAGELTGCQNSPLTFTASATGGTPPYDFSVLTTTHGIGIIDSVVGNTATITFIPTPSFVGTGSITVDVTDVNGCADPVTIPVVISPELQVSSESIGTCTATLSSSLVPLVTGGLPPYIFAQTGTLNPTGCGTVTVAPDGTFDFVAPAGFTGNCGFEFVVNDSSSDPCSGTGTVTVEVSDPLIAQDATLCSCNNTPVTANLNSFVSGGNGPRTFTLLTPIAPGTGTLMFNAQTGQFTFRPAPGFSGTVSFEYLFTDSSTPACISTIGTVTISVPCCFPLAVVPV